MARGPLGGPPRHLGWPAAVSLEFGGPRSFLSVALHKVIDDNKTGIFSVIYELERFSHN